jgi:Domain of unknown function (DUF5666)
MNRGFVVAVASAALCLLSLPVHAQELWARGKVTAVSDSSITLSVKGTDMTFSIGPKTEVIASGAGTATKEAYKEGKPGIVVTDIIKVGQGAEVHYTESGGTRKATQIRSRLDTGEGALSSDSAGASGKSTTGVVTAVTGNDVTVKSTAGTQTFTVDKNTDIVGKGIGTATREKKKEGAGPMVSDLIKVDDRVTVSYEDTGGKLHAKSIRVTSSRPPGTN